MVSTQKTVHLLGANFLKKFSIWIEKVVDRYSKDVIIYKHRKEKRIAFNVAGVEDKFTIPTDRRAKKGESYDYCLHSDLHKSLGRDYR